jgi:putative two-component system response regulator
MKKKDILLIVDDGEINRAALSAIFEGQYRCIETENGEQALLVMEDKKDEIGAVLLDLIMPVMNGYQTMDEMRKRELLPTIPVIIITADDSTDSELKAFDAGASEVITKPFEAVIVKRRVENVLELNEHRERQEELIQEQADKIRRSGLSIIEALAAASETRSMETGLHIRRVGCFTKILLDYLKEHCPEYQLTDHEINVISDASSLHDIGKIGIPDSVLNKPGRLTPEEFEIIKTHTTKGSEILSTLRDSTDQDYIRSAYDICLYHHERWDGRGYLKGLSGDEIPISAQVVGVADCYDALTNDRVYKKAIPPEEAIQMILDGKCGTFSPQLREALTSVKKEFMDLTAEYTGKGA